VTWRWCGNNGWQWAAMAGSMRPAGRVNRINPPRVSPGWRWVGSPSWVGGGAVGPHGGEGGTGRLGRFWGGVGFWPKIDKKIEIIFSFSNLFINYKLFCIQNKFNFERLLYEK
jgi:hypothetical protein